ncbi:MAG: serine hydrolase domain-containing protein, partial [Pseudomonadota bacterium]
PATTDTLFGIGSITKSFVAIAILQLVEAGELDLDDPVSEHLPFELGRPDKPIRIRHLLTHSPGFPNLATSSVLISRGLGEDTGVPMASADDFFRFVNGATDEIAFEPGEHFFYNNAAWRMLGAIVQSRSGLPFHDYVTQKVIGPLGMTRTTFDTAALFADPDHLIPHRRRGDSVEPAPFPYPNPVDNPKFSFLSAAGGISSSVTEMTRYMIMLIEGGRHADGQLVSERSMRQMQTLQIDEPDGYYGRTGYGFGLGITPDFLGETLIDHGGSISVSTAHMALVPAKKIGVVMMGNSSGMNYGAIAQSVLAILLGKNPATAVPSFGVRERMATLAGHYSTYRDVEALDVVLDGGMLYLQRDPDGTKVPLLPEDPSYRSLDHYLLNAGRKTPVEFRRDEQGNTSVLIGRYVYHQRD